MGGRIMPLTMQEFKQLRDSILSMFNYDMKNEGRYVSQHNILVLLGNYVVKEKKK